MLLFCFHYHQHSVSSFFSHSLQRWKRGLYFLNSRLLSLPITDARRKSLIIMQYSYILALAVATGTQLVRFLFLKTFYLDKRLTHARHLLKRVLTAQSFTQLLTMALTPSILPALDDHQGLDDQVDDQLPSRSRPAPPHARRKKDKNLHRFMPRSLLQLNLSLSLKAFRPPVISSLETQ